MGVAKSMSENGITIRRKSIHAIPAVIMLVVAGTMVVVSRHAYLYCIGFHACGVYATLTIAAMLVAQAAIVAVWFMKVICRIAVTRAVHLAAVATPMPMRRIRNRMMAK
jgi:cytochrome c oxidase subunit IV